MALKMFDLTGAEENYRFSPYCWRVRLACAHKGLPLQRVPWRFMEKDRLPKPNQGTVPVLVDGDHVVSDSWKIALHLEERHPDKPLFDSPQAKAKTLLIKYWVERTLHPFVTRMTVHDAWAGLHEGDRAYFRESREKRLGKSLEEVVADREQTRAQMALALEPLQATLAEQPFVDGVTPACGDYVVFGLFMWARCVSDFDVLAKDDSLHSWRDKMLALYDGMGLNAPRNPARPS